MGHLQELEELFARVLALPEAERSSAITELTAQRPQMQQALQAMLLHHAQAADFLEVSVTDPKLHRLFGSWRLEKRIGMGGMGDVYLASRADGQFQMQAALKLLPSGLGSQERRHRFLQERQILASLDHPFVARLLDGGISDDGQPYLVMEYVDGVGLLEAVECKKLPDRLRLFIDVASAVEYAHGQLVVHADLKPSNVMVRRDGLVKLLDFGIAWVDRDGFEGAKGATAKYASPEQQRGDRPTVASDVFSLGILLADLASPPSASGAPSASISQPELRAIVQRATAASADARYRTVGELRREIERWLQGRPVEAMGAAPAYRLRKFLGRHWFAASAAGVVLAFAGYALEQRWQAEAHFQELKRAARIMVFDVYEGIQYLSPPPDVMERIVESSLQVMEALGKTKNPDASLLFDLASSKERLAELLIVSGGDRQRADQLLEQSVSTTRALIAQNPRLGSYHRLLASGLQYVAERRKEVGDTPGALRALAEMEQATQQALALPEPKSRDWMYLSLIDLKRGELLGAAELRRAIGRIAERQKQSPFRDSRHQLLQLEAWLRLAQLGQQTPTATSAADGRAALLEFERLASALRSAGRLSGMVEMRLGLEAAKLHAPAERQQQLARAKAAAELVQPTQSASPAYHLLFGQIEEALGNAAAARACYERALQLNQFHEQALRRLLALRWQDPARCTPANRADIDNIARRLGEEKNYVCP